MDLSAFLCSAAKRLLPAVAVRKLRACHAVVEGWSELSADVRRVLSRRLTVSTVKEILRQLSELAARQRVSSQHVDNEVVRDFVARRGRRPRMLHISNIANNAYNNAKLLRGIGFECDVLCHDFYHMMSCPEWEDADFEGRFESQWYPDWDSVDLKGFERPRWFVQGSVMACLYYLLARHEGRSLLAGALWEHMADERRQLAHGGELDPGFIQSISQALTPDREDDYSFDARVDELVRQFGERFPERPDQLSVEDLETWRYYVPYWRSLLKHYDVVQAYGVDPVIPMLADLPCFAFEHGTLREIPFENRGVSRATALGYALAEWVFVTNTDCMEQATSLAGDRITVLNHPYDEDNCSTVAGSEQLRAELCGQLDADFLFFFPTRHDWVARNLHACKANDVFLRAFCELREQGFRVGLVCCQWGEDVGQSLSLLETQGCGRHVRWNEPLAIAPFVRMCKACDIVVDQFVLGAFGGVFFKSMAAGVPVCSYLDEAAMQAHYGSCPPLVNCRTQSEIVLKMKGLIGNPEQLKDLGEAGRAWIKKHHSAAETIERQMQVYEPVLCPRTG